MVTAMARQRRRLWLASAAIALSVGYLAGALTLLNRVSDGLTDLSAAGIERADLVIEGDVAYESALEQTRRLISTNIAVSLVGQPDVAAVVPRVEDIAVIIDPKGNSLVAPGLTEQPIGANWPGDPKMSPYEFVGRGRAPKAADEVVIDHRSAERAGIKVGDSVSVVARGGLESYRVVGVVTTSRGDLPDGSSLALFTTDKARQIFAMENTDTRVAIRLDQGANVEEVRSRIESGLPPGTVIVTGEEAAVHRQESVTRSFTLVRSLIMGFAGLALVVGMVTAANSLTLLYSERRLTFATFRLVGAKRPQILVAALAEAALLAGVASVAGAPLGLLLGAFIELILGAIGTPIPVSGSPISVPAIATAVLVGAAATVLAAIVPAWKACGVPAIEAITPTQASTPPTLTQRLTKIMTVALCGGLVLWAFLVIGDLAQGNQIEIAVGAALAMAALGMVPTGLAYAVSAGILVFPESSTALKRIGARDAIRNRSRTAATTGALLLATAVVTGIAVFLTSFSASLDGDVSRLIKADLVVDSGTFTVGGLPSGLLGDLAKIDGVDAVSGWQVGRVYIGQLPARLTGMDGNSLDRVLSPGWVGPAPQGLTDSGILLSQPMAEQLKANVGDTLPVVFTSQATEMLRVEGIYSNGDVLLGAAVVTRSLLSRQVPKSIDIAALVSASGDLAAVRRRVEAVAKDYGVKSVLAPSEFVNSRSELLRGFERVIQWMLLFTLVQALVGVINTLLLSVGERRREFGLLRAAGASRQQILRVVLIEGGSFAVVGTILGIVVGTFGAWVAMLAIRSFGVTGFVVPIPMLLFTAIAAAGLGIISAVIPARWAASVPPLEAVVDSGGAAKRRSLSQMWGDLVGWVEGAQLPWPRPTVATAGGPSAHTTARSGAMAGGNPRVAGATTGSGAGSGVGAGSTTDVATGAGTGRSSIYDSDVPPPYRPWMRADRGATGTATGQRPGMSAAGQAAAREAGVAPAARGPVFSAGPRAAGRSSKDFDDVVIPPSLAALVGRLDPASVVDAGPLLVLLDEQLKAGEMVERLVQGWVKGLPCVVADTGERVVVLVSKFPDPLIQSLNRSSAGVSIFGPPNLATVSMAVIDGNRLLEVIGIRDREEALTMAKKADPNKADQKGYF